MSRRRDDLIAQARLEGAARVAPQRAALSEALAQAIADRDTALHAATGSSRGIQASIHAAAPNVKRAYSSATREAGLADKVAAGLATGPIASAMAREKAAGVNRLAESKANALSELSNRRIESAAGAAFQRSKALSDYVAERSKLGTRSQSLAAQEGLYASSSLSKLEAHASDQAFQAGQQRQRIRSQSTLQSERLASSEAVAGARLRSSEHRAALGRRQQKLGRVNQQQLQAERLAARAGGAAAQPPARVYKGRADIETVAQIYKQEIGKGRKLTDIANDARSSKKGYPPAVVDAAADLATKGHISPAGVQKLAAVGIDVPPEWTGVTVKPHTRRRPARRR